MRRIECLRVVSLVLALLHIFSGRRVLSTTERHRGISSSNVGSSAKYESDDVKQHSLFESFPNIRALAPLAPEAEWNTTQVPLLPPETSHGVLDNGLTYFVQENREPKARAELFLIVGFGSLVEEEEERGIAHIIEHLGFSATKAYENHAIVKFLESIGAPFGACQNAYTSFDRTVYTLHIPTDKEGLLTESLTVLREFAFFTRISEEDLDKERNVVLEEWRETRTAQGRLTESYIRALAKGCKYCDRLPIGTEDVIRNVKAETLRKFYRKFYHPARMAVVAVGDFNGTTIVKTIRDLFDLAPHEISPLARVSSEEAPERPWHAVPESDGIVVASSTDPELNMAQGIVDCKRERLPATSFSDFRRRIREELFHKAFSNRLLKLTLEPKGPRNFFAVETGSGNPIPPLEPMSIYVAPLPGRMRYTFQDIARELERVKRFGFHESEVMRAKKSVLAAFEAEFIERDQQASENFANDFVKLFLDGIPAPDISQEAQVAVTIVPAITCEEVSAVAGQFSFENNVVVKIATPPFSVRNFMYTAWGFLQACWQLTMPTAKMDLPNEDEVAALLKGVEAEELEQWPEDEDDVDTRLQRKFDSFEHGGLQELRSESREVHANGVPKPLCNGSLAMDAPLGEEIILQNGLRIFLKETDLFDDEILLRGQRWGGLTKHQKASRSGSRNGVVSTEARVCASAAMMLGICGLSIESLQECLDGKRCDPGLPQMSAYSTSFAASTSPSDLEFLLTFTNLLFRCPVGPTDKSRGRLTLVKLGLLANRLAELRDPTSRFSNRVVKCITSDDAFYRPSSLLSVLQCNFKKASNVFNECASAPKEWTVCLAGKLPPKEVLLPLLEKYLGAIPNEDELGSAVATDITPRQDELELRKALAPLSVTFPASPVREDVHLKMVEPKGSNVICFPIQLDAVTSDGDSESAEAELRDLFLVNLVVSMLETRLIEVLRFQHGQIYGVSVGTDFSAAPPKLGVVRSGTLRISFACDPADSDKLIDVTLAELTRLRNGSSVFTDANVAAALEQSKRNFEESTRKNEFWANMILELYFSRAYAVTGEIGATMALWWRVRAEVNAGFTAASAGDAFRALLPDGVSSAVIAMRPKPKWSEALRMYLLSCLKRSGAPLWKAGY